MINKIPFTYTPANSNFLINTTNEPVYQNLKIKGVPEVLIYDQGNILTREKANNLTTYTFFDYYQDFFLNTFIVNETTPHLICFCEGVIPHLNYIEYEEPVQQYLNKKGLNIYFWELIVPRIDNTTDHWPIKLNPNDSFIDIFNKNKNSIVGFESTQENLDNLKCFDFDAIDRFAKKNNLTNITIYSGNYKNQEYYGKNYPNLKFKVKDLATASMFQPTNSENFTSYSYNPSLVTPAVEKINYKFWSGNKRSSGPRNLIAAYLLHRSSLVSYCDTCIDFLHNCAKLPEDLIFWKNINNKLWFDFNEWETKYPKIYNRLTPGMDHIKSVKNLHIDKKIDDITTDFLLESVPAEYYHSCFCAIVTESEYAQPCGHYADKTLNAIKCFRPFVLVAPPCTLEYLKQCGVKTFDKWWDESYDQELNHEKRLIKILKLIDYIDSFSIDELRDMYQEMIPILEHNYKVIENLRYQ